MEGPLLVLAEPRRGHRLRRAALLFRGQKRARALRVRAPAPPLLPLQRGRRLLDEHLGASRLATHQGERRLQRLSALLAQLGKERRSPHRVSRSFITATRETRGSSSIPSFSRRAAKKGSRRSRPGCTRATAAAPRSTWSRRSFGIGKTRTSAFPARCWFPFFTDRRARATTTSPSFRSIGHFKRHGLSETTWVTPFVQHTHDIQGWLDQHPPHPLPGPQVRDDAHRHRAVFLGFRVAPLAHDRRLSRSTGASPTIRPSPSWRETRITASAS